MELGPCRRALASSSPPASSSLRAALPRFASQDAPRLRGEQLAADEVKVRQREVRPGAGEMLGEAAIADLRCGNDRGIHDHWATAGLGVLVAELMWVDLRTFHEFFVVGDIYDPTSSLLLAARGFVPQ